MDRWGGTDELVKAKSGFVGKLDFELDSEGGGK